MAPHLSIWLEHKFQHGGLRLANAWFQLRLEAFLDDVMRVLVLSIEDLAGTVDYSLEIALYVVENLDLISSTSFLENALDHIVASFGDHQAFQRAWIEELVREIGQSLLIQVFVFQESQHYPTANFFDSYLADVVEDFVSEFTERLHSIEHHRVRQAL